jgi:capsular polysaccharide transport system ATP-binding protein
MIMLDRVRKSYRTKAGRKTVLDEVSAVFQSGHNFGILGCNGAGKSTLIRLLAGSEAPDTGIVRRYARVSFPLGFGGSFHGALSGRENVAFIARVYGAAIRDTNGYVEEFAELGEYFEMPVNTYSAGMRARLAFATCLAIDFDVYLIDEVTEIGDQRFRRRCAEAFRQRMVRSDIILVTPQSSYDPAIL